VFGIEIEVDSDDGSSLSSRASILSKSRGFDRRPITQRKDVVPDVDAVDKMKVTSVYSNNNNYYYYCILLLKYENVNHLIFFVLFITYLFHAGFLSICIILHKIRDVKIKVFLRCRYKYRDLITLIMKIFIHHEW